MTDSKTIEDSQPHLNVDDHGEGVAITKMFNIYDPWEDLWIFLKSYIYQLAIIIKKKVWIVSG